MQKSNHSTLREALLFGEKYLFGQGIKDASIDAWILLEHVTKVSRSLYFADPGRLLTEQELEQYETLIKKRGTHVPVQHLTGEQEFMGLTFHVNENVLIPRQDTEDLVETAMSFLEKCPKVSGKMRILDLGTGSGCILLSIVYAAKQKGISVEGVGTDISRKALEIAKRNAKEFNLDVKFIESNLFERIKGEFSMILSNPPYIKTGDLAGLMKEVRLHDPILALDGKWDGLYFYREIIKRAGEYLKKSGFLFFEIGCNQSERVTELMQQAGYRSISVRKDLAGLNRVVWGIYTRDELMTDPAPLERTGQNV